MSEVFGGPWAGAREEAEVWWVPWTLVGALAGVLTGALKVIRDLTVPRAVEERLRESEKRFRVFFETANDGILLHDAGGGFSTRTPRPSICWAMKGPRSWPSGLRTFIPGRIS